MQGEALESVPLSARPRLLSGGVSSTNRIKDTRKNNRVPAVASEKESEPVLPEMYTAEPRFPEI